MTGFLASLFFSLRGARMVSVLFLLRMLAPPGGLMVPRPTWGTEMTVSVSTVMDPDEAPSPLAVGRRPKTRGGGGALCSDVVGVFSSLLYPDSDPDSAVDSGAIEDDTESLRSFRVIVDAESVSVSGTAVLGWRCTRAVTESSNDRTRPPMAGVAGRLLSTTVSSVVEELVRGVLISDGGGGSFGSSG